MKKLSKNLEEIMTSVDPLLTSSLNRWLILHETTTPNAQQRVVAFRK